MRAPKGEQGQAREAQVAQLVQQVNDEFGQDLSVLMPVLQELDQILHQQDESYSSNVTEIIRSCEEQQKVLKARRERSLESTDEIQAKSDLPAEWNKWLNRCKALSEGERLVMNANTSNPYEVTLVWIG